MVSSKPGSRAHTAKTDLASNTDPNTDFSSQVQRVTNGFVEIDAQTKLAAVIGSPIQHSKSPAIHNAGFEASNINARYIAFDIGQDQIEQAIEALKTLGILGYSVTMPLKEIATEYVDILTPTAKKLGAINTIYPDPHSSTVSKKLIGDNTDGAGFIRGLKEQLNIEVDSANIVIFGAGGAARSVICACADADAQRITVINRNRNRREHALAVAADMTVAAETGSKEARIAVESADIIINATPIGMGGHKYRHLSPVELPEPTGPAESKIVCDLIYHPEVTPLLHQAKALGYRTQNGLAMLVHQAAIQFEYFTGLTPPTQVMYDAVLKQTP